MTNRWAPWDSVEDAEISKVRGICFDVDDTFSTHGKITAEAFQALWKAREAGLVLVPVTGRPAGWADHFARFWPVDAVVGENGAFTFFMQDGKRRRLDTPMEYSRDEALGKLRSLQSEILTRFPHAQFSSDQSYREYDLAIDTYEDVPPWPESDVDELLAMCRNAGAEARLSSVHVNTWFGSYDKYSGFTHWLAEGAPGASQVLRLDEWIYLGDSPNDEPMFSKFERCVGVANVLPFRPRMPIGPRWVSQGEGGSGFAQVVERLLKRH